MSLIRNSGVPVLYPEGDQIIGASQAGMPGNQNTRDEVRY